MEHGIKELNKLLEKFNSMTASDYLALYDKLSSRRTVDIADGYISTKLTYTNSTISKQIDFLTNQNFNISNISYEKDSGDVLTLKSEMIKAA